MSDDPAFDSDMFRRVLGRVPTGVTVVTCRGADGRRHGLVIGSFTSLSLDPPLIAFMPAKTSTTFPHVVAAGSFCVNVLAADQAAVCRGFFAKDDDRFERWEWSEGVTGAPILDGAVAWIECELGDVFDGGDHHIVIGRVRTLQGSEDAMPLIFFSGGYGRFSGHSLAAWRDASAVEQLRYVDIAHEQMQSLSRSWSVESLALVREETDMMVLASTGSEQVTRLPTRVGLRLPIVPPMGALLVAWDEPEWAAWWLAAETPPSLSGDVLRAKLELVRSRGFSLVLSSGDDEYDELVARQSRALSPGLDSLRSRLVETLAPSLWEPRIEDLDGIVNVRTVSSPVLTPLGSLAFMLTVFGSGRMTPERLAALINDVQDAARRVTAQIAEHRVGPQEAG